MSGWIPLDEAIAIVESALGKENALQRLEHRIWEAQVSTKVTLVETWSDLGRTIPPTLEDQVLFTRLAIKGYAREAIAGHIYSVEHADLKAGDFNVATGGILISVFGLRVLKEDVLWAFNLPSSEARPRTISPVELRRWISDCGTANSKVAYRQLRAEHGPATPKREEEFLPAWREVKGHRRQGRPKKSPG